ncbi:MAG: hypothetical protein CM15mP46_6960 [Alphaproteobacteria bacterium]|nr:MAG: hypothetical protein CM15mP46_6960 [Alphaproteobacteria bacterium]
MGQKKRELMEKPPLGIDAILQMGACPALARPLMGEVREFWVFWGNPHRGFPSQMPPKWDKFKG